MTQGRVLTQESFAEEIQKAGPFLIVSQMPVVKCHKCGRETPAPGRIAFSDGVTIKYFCDCVTEAEMDEIATAYNDLIKLVHYAPTGDPV